MCVFVIKIVMPFLMMIMIMMMIMMTHYYVYYEGYDDDDDGNDDDDDDNDDNDNNNDYDLVQEARLQTINPKGHPSLSIDVTKRQRVLVMKYRQG